MFRIDKHKQRQSTIHKYSNTKNSACNCAINLFNEVQAQSSSPLNPCTKFKKGRFATLYPTSSGLLCARSQDIARPNCRMGRKHDGTKTELSQSNVNHGREAHRLAHRSSQEVVNSRTSLLSEKPLSCPPATKSPLCTR